jgi:DHA2 family multidrug resistance protein
VQTQASFLGYVNAFWVLMLISVAVVPPAFSSRKAKLSGPVHTAH